MYDRGHKEYDKASKWLIMHYGDSLLRLAGATSLQSWQAMQAEVVQPRRLPDGLIKAVLADGVVRYYLLEVATDYRASVAEQMAEDMLHVLLDQKRLPRAILLVLDPTVAAVATSMDYIDDEGVSGIRVFWQAIKLADLSADELLAAGDVGLVPWAALAKSEATPSELARRCGQEIVSRATAADRESLLAVTQVLLHLRYAYKAPNLFDLLGGKLMPIEVPFIKELLDAAEARAAAELEKATREAAVKLEEATRDERRTSILEILDVRFGTVPEAVVQRLEQISDLTRLAQLHRISAVCADLAEFERKLAE